MGDLRRHPEARLGLIVLALALAPACGSSLRTVPRGPASGSARSITVDYPPPPAEVEQLPPDPGKPCAWQDGHWVWAGRRWRWAGGKWVTPPPGCHYVDPRMSWAPAHEGLRYWLPRWSPDRTPGPACKAPVTCGTRAPRKPQP